MLKHLLERRQDEEKGFTLIELMVVVLIMGILMAIAIPTFLSTRGSANDASAKSNATNAFTNEKSYYAANQEFVEADSTTTGATLDDSLPWGPGSGQVEAVAETGCAVNDCAVLITALSNSDNCFYIYDSETADQAIIAYTSNAAAASGGCTSPTLPTAEPSTANAGSSGDWALAW